MTEINVNIHKSDFYAAAHIVFREAIAQFGAGKPAQAATTYRIAHAMFAALGNYSDSANWAAEALADSDKIWQDQIKF